MSEYEKKIMNSGKKPTKRSLSLCMIETENPTFGKEEKLIIIYDMVSLSLYHILVLARFIYFLNQ